MARGNGKVLDRLFRALASRARRNILRLAAREKCAVTQLAVLLKIEACARTCRCDVALKIREGRYRWCRARRSAFALALASIEELCGVPPRSPRRRAEQNIDILPAINGEDSYGAGC